MIIKAPLNFFSGFIKPWTTTCVERMQDATSAPLSISHMETSTLSRGNHGCIEQQDCGTLLCGTLSVVRLALLANRACHTMQYKAVSMPHAVTKPTSEWSQGGCVPCLVSVNQVRHRNYVAVRVQSRHSSLGCSSYQKCVACKSYHLDTDQDRQCNETRTWIDTRALLSSK